MRQAQQSKRGQWYIIEERAGVCHIGPIDWGVDRNGYWPRVDFILHDLEEKVSCPCCGQVIALKEMDLIFGVTNREGCDVIILCRCLNCRLPYRVRIKGLINGYPYITERMEGWASWEKRGSDFEAEEKKLYGQKCRS